MSVKQVIVMRKDLNMRKGKMVAQGAHASMKVMMEKMSDARDMIGPRSKFVIFTPEELEWVEGIFTKICVSVNSEQELLDVYNKAKEAGLNCALIRDNGLTEFGGVPTLTCCAVGPNASEKIDAVTGGLPLL
jgi:PTH2 family peptidyl-tRNA hydrolase